MEVRIGKRHDETDGHLELISGISYSDGCGDVAADDSCKSPESSWGVADVIPTFVSRSSQWGALE